MLTLSDLHRLTPAVFATEPHPNVSPLYEFMPTLPIIQELIDRGWMIRSAHQNSRRVDPYASHRIVFDVPNVPEVKKVGDVYPTCTLFNSHNRTRRRSFVIGFFRTWCSNQAQVAVLAQQLDRIHIIGHGRTDAQTTITAALEQFGTLATEFNNMTHRVLTPAEADLFGRQALSIKRYGEPKFADLYTTADSQQVLAARREVDAGDSLWLTYNRLQESLLHGSARGVNEVNQNRKINLVLWDTAKTYLLN